MMQSPAVRLITELALANKGFVVIPSGGVDGNALIKSGTGVVWGSGTGGTAVNSVNNRTGAVKLSASDVNLANVDNTSDDAKPLSAATQAALDGKADYPIGGTNGQVLTKSGATTSWTSVSGSGTGGPSIIAPSPSGADDTATLQALLTQAQATGGTLVLQAGNYLANLATAQSFNQPRIVGQGKYYTQITAVVNTKPVLRFKGGSGKFSGGYIADLTVHGNSGGVGIEIADACGMRWSRIAITGAFAEGMTFHNEGTNGFAEYNHGDCEFTSEITMPVRYKRTGGAESFHGTGFTIGTVFNQNAAAVNPLIQIDDGCFPYNAPLTAAIFTRATTPIIRCSHTTAVTRAALFHGNLDIENFIAGAVLVDTAPVNGINYSGTVNVLGKTSFDYGDLTFVEYTYYNDTGLFVRRKTMTVGAPSSATAFGEPGMIAQDGTYLYVCTAANTWKRVALATW